MATSGTSTFSRNRDQIIKAAARKVGAIEAGETPDDDTVSDFSEALNAMVKHWQGNGTFIWTTTEGILFTQPDQTQYTLGPGSTDHATESFVETTLSSASASASATLIVSSETGLAADQYILVELDSGAWHPTTIASVASTTITLDDVLTGNAASGNRVVAYTTKIVRPLKVISARRYNFASALDTPLDLMDRIEYREMPNKTTEATVTAAFYDRRGGANVTGLFHVWPEPSNVDDAIKFTFSRPIQDFSVSGDDADFPQEWTQALIFNLAVVMAPEYDVPQSKMVGPHGIGTLADKYLRDATWNESELTAIEFVPDTRWR